MAQFEISWEAPEFEYHEKDVSWYWISIIVATVIVAFSVWEKNFLFGLFVVIAEALMIAWGNHEPRVLSFRLNEHGVTIEGGKFYALKEFESWSVDSDEEWAELLFNFRAQIKSPLKILIPTAHVEDVRKNLKTLLREVEHHISFLDAIEKLIRF